MGGGIAGLVVLDAISGSLLALVAYRSWSLGRDQADPIALLFAAGIAIVALSYPTVSASYFDLGSAPNVWDGLRIAGQTGGALIVLCAYATARLWGRARPGVALGWALVGATAIFAALMLVPPARASPRAADAMMGAHVVMVIAWTSAAAIAGGRSIHARVTARAAVPLAFAAFALSKVAWLVVDVRHDTSLLTVVYATRFFGIALLLAAVKPLRFVTEVRHAAA